MKLKTKFRILEFVFFGIISNMVDNLITLYFVGYQGINIHVVFIVLAVVIPFAILEELIVDHTEFWFKVCKVCGIKINEQVARSA